MAAASGRSGDLSGLRWSDTVTDVTRTASEVLHGGGEDGQTSHSINSIRYTPDGKYVAAGSSSGVVSFGAEGQRPMQFFTPSGDALDACTCVRVADIVDSFVSDPPSPADSSVAPASSPSYLIATSTAQGHVHLTRVVPGKRCSTVAFTVEENNQTMTCAVAPGSVDTIATGGSDGVIRLYKLVEGGDQLELVRFIDQGIDHHGQPTLGPPAKIMASTFVSEHALLVGGWESSVMLFDLRTKQAVRTFDGPRLSGDGLDVRDGCVLAASHRARDQLQVFELGTGKQLTPSVTLDSMPFACRLFGRASKLGAWVAGTTPHSVNAVNLLTGQSTASVTEFPASIFAVDVNPTNPAIATVGGGRDSLFTITARL